MSSLFLDTSYDQILGLLDDQKSWIAHKTFEGQKLTGVIHRDLAGICSANGVDPLSLKNVIYCAGPGFYTGLRVAYGIADVLRLHQIRVSSLYSYLIPEYCGFKNYIWITKAYRGEIFVYDSSSRELSLHQEKTFTNNFSCEHVFTHCANSVDENLAKVFPQMKYTQALLIKHPLEIFSQITSEEPLHYFRPLDEEYKPSL